MAMSNAAAAANARKYSVISVHLPLFSASSPRPMCWALPGLMMVSKLSHIRSGVSLVPRPRQTLHSIAWPGPIIVRAWAERTENGDRDDHQQDAPTHLVDGVSNREASQRRVSSNMGEAGDRLANECRRLPGRRGFCRPQNWNEAGGRQRIKNHDNNHRCSRSGEAEQPARQSRSDHLDQCIAPDVERVCAFQPVVRDQSRDQDAYP